PKLWKLLSQVLGEGEKLSKKNFKTALERLWRAQSNYQVVDTVDKDSISTTVESKILRIDQYCDWGEAPDVSIFYGRKGFLDILEQWSINDNCRLITLLGMGGIGKTTLSIKLAQKIQSNFQYVIWRSLQNAPPIEEVLTELIQFFDDEEEINLPDTTKGKISRLLHSLRDKRCLLLLDNFESVLQGGTNNGKYSQGYEDYGYLLQQIGQVNHQSCLIITSREKPKEVGLLEGPKLAVRTLQMSGLTSVEGQEIFNAKGCLLASDGIFEEVCSHYAGNPLALKIAASAIQEVCGGDLEQLIPFLREGKIQFDDINDLLERQFNRLSLIEQQVMYWLAVSREPISLQELEADFKGETVTLKLFNALQSLVRRAFIEQNNKQFLLQPVVLEYVTIRLIQEVCEEIINSRHNFLNNYALIKAKTKDYVRESQIRLIVQPIIDKLASELGNYTSIKNKLKTIIGNIKEELLFLKGYVAGNIINLLIHLKIDLTGYDFSDLTIRQAYLQGIDLHNVNFSSCDFIHTVFTKVFGGVNCVKFTPDGKLLGTTSNNYSIKIWQVDSGQQIGNFKGHSNRISNLDFSPDNQLILSASADRTIKIWDLRNGICINTIEAHENTLRTAIFHPNGKLIASCGDDQLIKFWDVRSGKCLKVLSGHNGWVLSISFSPDGKLIASGSNDQNIRIWEVETGKCIRVLQGHQDWVVNVNFSPVSAASPKGIGQRIVSSSFDRDVRIWQVSNVNCIQTLQGHTFWVWTAVFSPDGNQIASSGSDKTIKIWNVSDGRCLKTIKGHTNQIWSLSYHPDGRRIATGSDDQTVRIWDVTDGKCLQVIQGYTNSIKSVQFTPNSKKLVTAHQDCTVKIWDVFSHQHLCTLKGHDSPVLSVGLHPDGKLIASGSEDGTIKIWDIDKNKCLYSLSEHAADIWGISFSPDGQFFASGSYDKTIKIWRLDQKICIHTLKGYDDQIGAVIFNPEGSLLATAGESAVEIWDVASGKRVYILEEEEHKGRVKSVAFSPDGKLLVSGSTDKTIKIWDLSNLQLIRNLTGHDASVVSVALSPDGEKIVSSACEGTIRIWNVDDGKCIQELTGHQNWVWSVTFSPDGQFIASASQDESIILWDKTGKNIARMQAKRPLEGMQITEATGLTMAEKSDLIALGAI
ncbi:MAG: NB-ARC domain-containing protein, partial [Rivularia sp. ALOHA_DT_140]|nr:NB-ARC domain-containing protein [Rivularia sp. ALOHA_DT_140]